MSNLKILNCGNRWGNETKHHFQALKELQKATGLPDEAIECLANWYSEQWEKPLGIE